MNKLLKTLLFLGLIIPSIASATSAVPWLQKNITDTFIYPNTVNSLIQGIIIGSTATSTSFSYFDPNAFFANIGNGFHAVGTVTSWMTPILSVGKDVTNPLVDTVRQYAPLLIDPTITQTTNVDNYINGVSVDLNLKGSGNTAGPVGGTFAATYSGTGSLSDGVYGVNGIANLSSGTTVSLYGNGSGVNVTGGTVTGGAYTFFTPDQAYVGGSVANAYGLSLGDQAYASTTYNIWTNQHSGAASWAYYGAGAAKSYFGGNVGISSTTPYALLSIGNTGGIGFGLATSTFNTIGGINLASGGCFAIAGVCLTSGGGGSGTVTSVGLSSTNSTLTVGSTPVTTSGTITADLNLGHANVWTALQSFSGNASSSQESSGQAWFGATATSTFSTTGLLRMVTGAVATPAISFVQDTISGIYQKFVGSIAFVTNGIEAAMIDTNGNFGIGTTTTSGVRLPFGLEVATSTGAGYFGHFALMDSTSNTTWVQKILGGNLFFATTTIGSYATSTFARYDLSGNPVTFNKNGGCTGCTDIILPNGINLRNGKYMVATTSPSLLANTFQDIYTPPPGRRALISSFYGTNGTAGAITIAPYIKLAGSYYRLTATSTINANVTSGGNVGIVLDSNATLAVMETNAAVSEWFNMIEFDSSVPFFSASSTPPAGLATSTLYAVPAGAGALLLSASPLQGASGAQIGITNNAGSAIKYTFFLVKSGQVAQDSTATTMGNNVNIIGGVSLAANTSVSAAFGAQLGTSANTGDTVQYYFDTALSGTNTFMWLNVYEH